MPTIIKIISKYIYLNCYFSTLPMFMMEMEVFMNIQMTLGQQVRALRRQRRLTQEQLAEQLHLDAQYYSQLERGERNFTIEKIAAVCTIFHLGIDKIITIEPPSPAADTDVLLEEVLAALEGLSYHQLTLLKKFVTEIIPLTE